VSLGVKYLHAVGDELLQTQTVQLDGSSLGQVDSSEIQYQLSVDEDPQVVVSQKVKDLSSSVDERSGELSGEVVVVSVVVISPSLAVKCEHAGVGVFVKSGSARGAVFKGDVLNEGDVLTGDVSEPNGKILSSGDTGVRC